MTTYLTIPEHGTNGDFYRCGDHVFRADNLDLATRIAANHWLYTFDRLYRSCSLASIEPGRFTWSVTAHNQNGAAGRSWDETETVSYYGPADMFEIETVQDLVADLSPEFAALLDRLEAAADAGHPNVRRSNRTGRAVFTCQFPRWWPRETPYLSTDLSLARLQLQHAGVEV